MTGSKIRAASLAVALACLALSGAALAGNGNGSTPPGQENNPGNAAAAPGQQQTPPGQEKKEEPPAAPQAAAPQPAAQQQPAQGKASAPGQQKKAEKQEAKTAAKPASPGKSAQAPGQVKKQSTPAAASKPDKGSKSFKETSSGQDLEQGLAHKHTICHATGSASNPFVLISPAIAGVFNGHVGHQGDEDIIPPFTYKGVTYSQNWDAAGQAIFAAGCKVTSSLNQSPPPTGSTTQEESECPTRTIRTIERVFIGWNHKAGPHGKIVFVPASEGSAHGTKHGDEAVYEEREVIVTQPLENCDTTTTSTPTVSGGTTPTGGTAGTTALQPTAQPAAQQAAEQSTGGVAGAQATLSAPKAAGGVAGAFDRVGRVATGRLPFTGLPLWGFVALAAALLAAGLVARRLTRNEA